MFFFWGGDPKRCYKEPQKKVFLSAKKFFHFKKPAIFKEIFVDFYLDPANILRASKGVVCGGSIKCPAGGGIRTSPFRFGGGGGVGGGV